MPHRAALPLLLAGTLLLTACPVVRFGSLPVAAAGANRYLFIDERELRGLTPQAQRQAMLRRQPEDIGDRAPVVLGRRYRFVPLCGASPNWSAARSIRAREGLRVDLSCSQ